MTTVNDTDSTNNTWIRELYAYEYPTNTYYIRYSYVSTLEGEYMDRKVHAKNAESAIHVLASDVTRRKLAGENPQFTIQSIQKLN